MHQLAEQQIIEALFRGTILTFCLLTWTEVRPKHPGKMHDWFDRTCYYVPTLLWLIVGPIAFYLIMQPCINWFR